MPTTRRKQNTTSTRNQSTLSFNNKAARVTKPSVQDTSAANKKAKSKLSEPQEIEIEQATPAAETTEVEVSEQPAAEHQDEAEQEQEISIPVHPTPRQKKKSTKAPSKSSRETAASKVTDGQIKKYWKAEEDARLAPRGTFFPYLLNSPFPAHSSCTQTNTAIYTVHQSSISLHEKILRHFDLSSQYGPCIGLTRLSRWRRADTLGLNPPVEVLAVLMREENDKTSQGCGKIAYIDELGGGRVGIWE